MNPINFVCSKPSCPPWLVWLNRELAPFPGRMPMTIRLVVSVAMVTVISLALQVPQLAFSAFFCFFVTKENRVLTLFTGMLMILGVTVATIINLLLYTWTFDYPEIRIPIMACLIFCAMFLSRTFVIGPLGFAVGFFSALMITIGESAPDTDALVRNELWLWVAVIYPIALTIFVNQLLLPADPWTALVQAFGYRLDAARSALNRVIKDGSAGGQNNQPLLDLATRGSAIMFTYLHFAEMQHPSLKRRHPFLVETISAASHLVNATASVEFRDPQALSSDDILRAKILLSEIEQLKAVLPEKERVLTSRKTLVDRAALPQLRELQFAVESFRDTMIQGHSDYSSASVAKPKKPLFGPDAFTNPAHVRFGLKVTFAAMTCYILYNALHWPGIFTSFVTCCFIALGNTGATIYKSWLRFFGCLGGGFAGYVALFLLIPHMVSITSLVLLTIAGSALGGWIAAGSERISYAGLQFAFAFYLSIFQGYGPEVDLTTIRDRLVGILLGTIISAVVFRYVWPEHAADQLRVTLARVMRTLAQLVCLPKTGDPAIETERDKAMSLHGDLSRDMDSVIVLSEQTAVENVMFDNPKTFSTTLMEHITSHVQSLGLIATALLRRTKIEEWQLLGEAVQISEAELRAGVADYLKRVAVSVEKGQSLPSDGLEPAFAKWNLAAAGVVENDRPRLVRRLVRQVQALA